MIAPVSPNPTGHHPRDISSEMLESAITSAARPDLLCELVGLSRKAFGFYPHHYPYTISHSWAARKLEHSALGARVLDIGAGLSPMPLFLARRGAFVHTVDPHRTVRSLPVANDWNEWGFFDYAQLHPSLRSHHCSIADLVPSGKFDVIYTICVIAHLHHKVRKSLLRRSRDLLRRGGVLLLAVDLVPSTNLLWNHVEGREVEPLVEHGTIDDVLNQLCDLGFQIDEARTLRDITHSRTEHFYIAAVLGHRQEGTFHGV